MFTEAPCHKSETRAILKCSHLSDANQQFLMRRTFHRIYSTFDPVFQRTTSVFADLIIPLEFKDFFFVRLNRGPAVSYPGCEGKNCSAAPSLPPAPVHLGKGWAARHHLKQETEEAWFLGNEHAGTCVPA